MFGRYLYIEKETLLTMQFHLIVRSFNIVKNTCERSCRLLERRI